MTASGRAAGPGSPHGLPGPTDDAPEEDPRREVEEVLRRWTARRCEEARSLDVAFHGQPVTALVDLALRGGRRNRAAFLWWGWRAAKGAPRGPAATDALRTAAALELLQTCALIHDDVMDDSALRRGRPSLHTAFARRHRRDGLRGDPDGYGRAVAVLAGDLALAWADDLFAESLPDGAVRHAAQRVWRVTRTEMVAGQFLDLRAQAAGGASPAAALRVARLKSALYTVERPLHLGAVLGGADAGLVAALRAAGRRAGLAFQLRDDLLDLFGDPERTGKPTGGDVREGKPTYPVALALARAEAAGDERALTVLRESSGDRSPTGEGPARVRDVLTGLGVPAAVEERIARLSGSARRILSEACDDPLVARRLEALVRETAEGAGGAERG
ncbi:polyprenyl synthetase family protein [Streptomyces sp. TRM43335]|uniref:Polyprenyl synthetase family protein n=1 Tax=Streptomyces taklimakanensis TaxID=2569853 RepID=A0A6G2BJJ9_9ACTN|nr:polyprenyl synthetase family protein [Streptomyces taklimakanensis]MTE22249.1 polyprenyl synthetase family protein [Streptomyces taklimakanensis]